MMHHIILECQSKGGNVIFDGKDTGGKWLYDEVNHIMYMEFKVSKKKIPARRHALQARSCGTAFDLIPKGNEIYLDLDGTKWSSGSEQHYNAGPVVMQTIDLVDSLWSIRPAHFQSSCR